MQPSQFEIQREVEALRDLRRRSTTPGALSIDPDLPTQPSPSSPSTAYWAATTDSEASSSSSSHDGRSTAESSATSLSGNNIGGKKGEDPADDPFHLFWVPASVHPEIAPAEFRAFLQEHARSPSTSEDATVSRSSSISSPLGRKRSMLSRQYRPSEDDGVDQEREEKIVPLRRNRTSIHTNPGPQLTIDDLQKLERLAEKASRNDDPSELRTMLRRSLSLNISPTAIEGMGKLPDLGDESDVPIIVPPPGQILRRAARTKIRKPGLPGDGGGHRFGASRRTRTRTLSENRTSSDQSSSEHGHTEEFTAQPPLPQRFSEEGSRSRPDSYSDASSIFDAYAREEDEADALAAANQRLTASPPLEIEELSITESEPEPEPLSQRLSDEEPVLRHPQPTRLLSPPLPAEQPLSRTPSPSETATSSSIDFPSHPSELIQPQHNTPPQQPGFVSSPPSNRKEKDKKGLFGKWGSDKGSKKASAKEKEKERENREHAEKEKESFFGSLFGGKKNKDSDPNAPGAQGRQSPLAARNKTSVSSPAPGSPLPPGVNNYSRYPIHVERAIYRLSHIKLANPRRPLYEQVLISNLMFWYLGVINKAQQQQQQQQQPVSPPPNDQAMTEDGTNGPTLLQEQERREREQQEAERQRLERESTTEQAPVREPEPVRKKESSPRRGPLTKPPPSGAGPRRAEMPVRGPQYEMQHRAMEQQYSYGMNSPQPYPVTSQPPTQPQPSQNHQSRAEHPPQQSRLPPGAMPPVDQSKPVWGAPPNTRTGGASPPPLAPSPRRSKSPPTSHMNMSFTEDRQSGNGGAPSNKYPSRSHSATVSPPASGVKVRKGSASVNASIPSSHQWKSPSYDSGGSHTISNGGHGEEEDVPLAVWQQSRRSR